MEVELRQLAKVLRNFRVEVDEWDEKILQMLVNEINCDESYLVVTSKGLLRVVHAVRMIIRPDIPPDFKLGKDFILDDIAYLVEKERIFPDGRRVVSWRCPVGKIRGRESGTQALVRELKEKLGLAPTDFKFYFIRTEGPEVRPIISYPGLPTRYCLEVFFVWLTVEAARRIFDGLTRDDNGVIVTFGWETLDEFRARQQCEQVIAD